jgi:DnaK suppressor protein
MSKTSYTDAELQEFEAIILKKMNRAKEDLKILQEQISNGTGSGDGDYKFNGLDDSNAMTEKEQLNQMAARQAKFISHLDKALMRIKNKTYGICRETGNLIDAKRLRAVPHATLSIEAKLIESKRKGRR